MQEGAHDEVELRVEARRGRVHSVISVEVVKQEACPEDPENDPVGCVVQAVLQGEIVAQEGQSVEVEHVCDEIDLVRAEKGCLCLMVLDRVDVRSDLVEDLFKNVVSQGLGSQDHEDEDENDAKQRDESQDEEQEGQSVEITWCILGVRSVHPVHLDVLGVVAQLGEEDAIVNDREGQIAEELIWVLEFTLGVHLEGLPEEIEHADHEDQNRNPLVQLSASQHVILIVLLEDDSIEGRVPYEEDQLKSCEHQQEANSAGSYPIRKSHLSFFVIQISKLV